MRAFKLLKGIHTKQNTPTSGGPIPTMERLDIPKKMWRTGGENSHKDKVWPMPVLCNFHLKRSWNECKSRSDFKQLARIIQSDTRCQSKVTLNTVRFMRWKLLYGTSSEKKCVVLRYINEQVTPSHNQGVFCFFAWFVPWRTTGAWNRCHRIG